jgi:hypothetical protein
MILTHEPELLHSLELHEIDSHPYRQALNKEWEKCGDYNLEPSIYFLEAIAYHQRAKRLQDRNMGLLPVEIVSGCPLQDQVHIYDTVNRWAAGFSNVPQEMFLGSENPKHNWNIKHGYATSGYRDKFKNSDWFYIFLIHRICGSGASFAMIGDCKLPPHGWYNTPVPYLCENADSAQSIGRLIKDFNGPMFSSIGNQIPSFNKPTAPYTQGGREYLVEVAPKLSIDFFNWLVDQPNPVGIQKAVDWCLDWQTQHGWRRFKFVLTAWVMDIAEYYPGLVDENSDCYHGINAIAALELVFKPTVRMNKQTFYDVGTRMFCDLFATRPMDVEDAAPGCDLIRYCEQYIQPKGYDKLDRSIIFNISHVKHATGRQPVVQ